MNLGPGLPVDVQGYLAYVFRDTNYIRDLTEIDDSLVLNNSLPSETYLEIADELFPLLVRIFSPYRASIILDEDLTLDGWEIAKELGRLSGKDEDGRDGVVRIPPVGYFDRACC